MSPAARAGLIVLAAAAVAAHATAAQADDAADAARRLLLTGHYTEAQAAYDKLGARDPVTAALGVAHCREAVGDRDGARAALAAAARRDTGGTIAAERARLEFARGRYDSAQVLVNAALRAAPEQPEAHYFAAELHRVAGRLDQANDGYRWFVRYYNREQDALTDPDVFRWIGLAGAQYARWNRVSQQFHFLVNTLYPDALARDSLYWPAHLDAALLFVEKYNLAAAAREIDDGLAINPAAAELHAARALVAFQQFDFDSTRAEIGRALAIDPRLPEALRLGADVDFVVTGPAAAVTALERVRALNPVDEATLGRLAAAYGAMDGFPDSLAAGTRVGRLVGEVVQRNPHCGEFFAALGSSLDLRFDYPNAARFYQEARRRMPQLVTVPGQLGLVAMRLGDEDRARKLLQEAFDIDPFNGRVKNTLDVLDVLAGYATIQTPHFILRYDPARDSLLARAASRWLEDEVYPADVKAMRYEPPGRTLVELFGSAKESSGHAWFSVRMVGLPFIGTVAASSGGMIAMTSPNDVGKPFNWARTLKHEFVHVLNLQQTRFAIPRWFTEGLAVRLEGRGTPGTWDRVLTRRMEAGKLFDLGTIQNGFTRPRTGDDWALAYAQAELYTRYIADTYGDGALNKLIDAYTDRLETPAAIQRSFGVPVAKFEDGYRRYVAAIVRPGKTASEAPAAARPTGADVPALEAANARDPKDATVLARLAYARLDAGRPYEARSTARKALELDGRQALAAIVVARVEMQGGNAAGARTALRAGYDPAKPDAELLAMLTDLTLGAHDYAAAESLLDVGARQLPGAADWQAGRVAVYRGLGRDDSLAAALARRAARDADDVDGRLELARLAMKSKDAAAAARWAGEALQVDITNADAHAALGAALAASSKPAPAADAYGTAVAIAPDKLEWRFAEAQAFVAAGRKDRARATLDDLLARRADYPGARELRDSLGR